MRSLLLSLALAAATGCFSKPERIDSVDAVDAAQTVDAPAFDGMPVNDARNPDGTVGGDPDAPPQSGCTPASCDGTCQADGFCEVQGADNGSTVRCGGASKCRFVCNASECKKGVDCDGADECVVRCIGTDACQGDAFPAVDCGGADCIVTCSGAAACQKGVSGTAGSCDASCCNGACEDGVQGCTRDSTCN